jgi:hypothetical protein
VVRRSPAVVPLFYRLKANESETACKASSGWTCAVSRHPLVCAGGIFAILIERVEAHDLRVESLPSIGSGVGLNGRWPLHWLTKRPRPLRAVLATESSYASDEHRLV